MFCLTHSDGTPSNQTMHSPTEKPENQDIQRNVANEAKITTASSTNRFTTGKWHIWTLFFSLTKTE